MLILILTLDAILLALLAFVIYIYVRPISVPYDYSSRLDPEVNRLLEVDKLDWKTVPTWK